MLRSRENDKPEDMEYLSRAREAIEKGLTNDEQSGDKQSGDGMIAVPIEKLNDSLNLIKQLKIDAEDYGGNTRIMDELEETLEGVVKWQD